MKIADNIFTSMAHIKGVAALLIMLAGLAFSGVASAVQPSEMLSDPVLEVRAREISKDIRCLVCQNQPIDDSDAEFAGDLRVLVRERLVAGDSDDQVKQFLVDRYGDYILLTPPFKTATLVLWFGPAFFLLCAALIAFFFLRRKGMAAEDAEPENIAPACYREGTTPRMRVLAGIIVTALPLMAGVLYSWLGTPGLPGKPFAEYAKSPEYARARNLAAIAETLEHNPDADGYAQLGEMLFSLGRYDESAMAYFTAIDLGKQDALIWSAMGEAIVMASGGIVVPDALFAFLKAYKLNKDERSQFYIGLAQIQIGDFKKAVAIWRNLENTGAPGASLRAMTSEHIALYAREGNFSPESVSPAPPPVAMLEKNIQLENKWLLQHIRQ